MAESSLFDPAVVKKTLRESGGKSVGFCLVPGKSGDDTLFAVSKKMTGARLLQEAKKDGASGRGSTGELVVVGKTLRIDSDGGSDTAVKKGLLQWLKKNGLSQYDVTFGGAGEGSGADEADDEEDVRQMFDPQFLVKMIQKSRKGPVNFGMGRGKKREDDLIAVHRKKPGVRLFKMVKAEIKSNKGTWGTFQLEGRELTFFCETDPLAGMKRLLKTYFTLRELPLPKIRILDPSGSEQAEEDEEEGGEDKKAQAERRSKIKALEKDYKSMLPALKERAQADAALRKAMTPLANGFKKAVDGEDVAAAETFIAQLRQALSAR